MKHIHFPTLALHAGLLLLAAGTIQDYPDFFLGAGVVLLIAHAIWAAKSKQRMALCHVLGCGAQFAVFHFGLIEVSSGAFGLGGGEFGLLFYQLALAVSCAVELVIGLLRRTNT